MPSRFILVVVNGLCLFLNWFVFLLLSCNSFFNLFYYHVSEYFIHKIKSARLKIIGPLSQSTEWAKNAYNSCLDSMAFFITTLLTFWDNKLWILIHNEVFQFFWNANTGSAHYPSENNKSQMLSQKHHILFVLKILWDLKSRLHKLPIYLQNIQ